MQTIQVLARFCVIVFFVTRHGLALALRVLWGWLTKRGPDASALAGETARKLCEAIGATFIKFGQIASARPDLLPPEIIAALLPLQDKVKPFDARRAASFIAAGLGQKPEEAFSRFEWQPLASASIAQVHRAYLPDGSAVAVKIRRPGLERLVKNDLKIICAGAYWLNKLPPLRLLPISAVVRDVGHSIEEQLDFGLEAERNRLFRNNFANQPQVRFPALVETLCTDSIITMEYMAPLYKVNDLRFTAEQRETMAVSGLRAFYRMIFIDGLIHCDMHPGNVFFGEKGELVILDTGLVAHLSEKTKKDFTDFFFGMATRNGQQCARIMYETATCVAPFCEVNKFTAFVTEVVEKHSAKNAQEFEVASFAADLFVAQRRFGVTGATDFIMTVISLLVFEGIMKQVYPALDFQDEARRFILAVKYGLRPPQSLPLTV